MVHTLDHATRKQTGVGNVSQIVLEVDGQVHPGECWAHIRRFTSALPVLRGRCRRDPLNLAPYWHIPRSTSSSSPTFQSAELDDDQDETVVFDALYRAANQPFRHPREHLAFTLLTHRGKSYLGMQFDHHLLDARGAELFADHLNHFFESGEHSLPVPPPMAPGLDNWGAKFRAGQKVNRTFLALKEGGRPASLDIPSPSAACCPARFVQRSFSARDRLRLEEQAEEKLGYLMILPYLLGCTVHAMHKQFSSKELRGPLVVPVNLDGRERGSGHEKVFFNHVSFLFFKFAGGDLQDLPALWSSAARQLYDGTKSGFPHAFAEAGMLMRILPPGALSMFSRLLFRGTASFAFSYIGRGGYTADRFMGMSLRNIHHMPRVPTPPGLGVFYTSHGQRLNLVLSYLDGMLDTAEADALVEALKTGLLGGGGNG
jgi:hypothetical protein